VIIFGVVVLILGYVVAVPVVWAIGLLMIPAGVVLLGVTAASVRLGPRLSRPRP
jgi:hypothetical protein